MHTGSRNFQEIYSRRAKKKTTLAYAAAGHGTTVPRLQQEARWATLAEKNGQPTMLTATKALPQTLL